MDTTETYIKMCEKAEEIQEFRVLGQNKQGDYFWRRDFPNLMILAENDVRKIPDGALWLPRQDQLQEMVKGESLRDEFYSFVIGVGNSSSDFNTLDDFYQEFQTWEQLWLAYVMKEKYQKRWNGTDWVKE